MEAINPKTVLEAIKSPSPSLAFFHQDSPIKAAAILTIIISDLVKFYNVGKTMNDSQVAQTINLILEDENLRSFKPDDFKLCFKRMKTGFYGKSYDRIDGQIIFEALYQYLHERTLECEQISIRMHAERFKESEEINPEGVKKVLAILKEAIKIAPEKSEIKKSFEKSPRDKFIQEQLVEFDKLCDKKPSVSDGRIITGRYTDMPVTTKIGESENGDPILETKVRPVDVTDFLKIKVAGYDLKQNTKTIQE